MGSLHPASTARSQFVAIICPQGSLVSVTRDRARANSVRARLAGSSHARLAWPAFSYDSTSVLIFQVKRSCGICLGEELGGVLALLQAAARKRRKQTTKEAVIRRESLGEFMLTVYHGPLIGQSIRSAQSNLLCLWPQFCRPDGAFVDGAFSPTARAVGYARSLVRVSLSP